MDELAALFPIALLLIFTVSNDDAICKISPHVAVGACSSYSLMLLLRNPVTDFLHSHIKSHYAAFFEVRLQTL